MKLLLLTFAVALNSCLAESPWAETNIVRIDSAMVIHGNDRSLKQIEKTYAGMSPVNFTPPPERWKQLARTQKCLQNGPALRVVMLGDSIVTDTSHSGWDLLTQRQYPHCRIEKITSVRGSTGCWWYKDNNRVQSLVLDFKPDLLIIGGISQHDDIESIREVIRQVRAGGSTADILLMTGAFGKVDPRDDKQWQEKIDPGSEEYRARLQKLAAETGSAFLDLSGAWGRYIRADNHELAWFKRDEIHSNERGEQILGRVLDRYLSPDAATKPGAKANTELPVKVRSNGITPDAPSYKEPIASGTNR